MGRYYSLDLRVRVASFVDAGHSRRAAARHFGVSDSFAIKLLRRQRQSGSPAPARQGRPRGTGRLAPYESFLVQTVEAKPAITMPELAARLREARGISAAAATLSRLLCRRGFTYKNLWTGRASQEAASGWARDGSHQSIRPRYGAPAPGHHGNPRTPGLLKAKASPGHFYSQASSAPGNRSSILSHPSREPREDLCRRNGFRLRGRQTPPRTRTPGTARSRQCGRACWLKPRRAHSDAAEPLPSSPSGRSRGPASVPGLAGALARRRQTGFASSGSRAWTGRPGSFGHRWISASAPTRARRQSRGLCG